MTDFRALPSEWDEIELATQPIDIGLGCKISDKNATIASALLDLRSRSEALANRLEALAQPEGEGPTAVEIQSMWLACSNPGVFARAVLARWGRPIPQPIPVSERPWEREGWCDAEGRCYGWDGDYWWMVGNPGSANETITHCLPHWALPLPQSK